MFEIRNGIRSFSGFLGSFRIIDFVSTEVLEMIVSPRLNMVLPRQTNLNLFLKADTRKNKQNNYTLIIRSFHFIWKPQPVTQNA